MKGNLMNNHIDCSDTVAGSWQQWIGTMLRCNMWIRHWVKQPVDSENPEKKTPVASCVIIFTRPQQCFPPRKVRESRGPWWQMVRCWPLALQWSLLPPADEPLLSPEGWWRSTWSHRPDGTGRQKEINRVKDRILIYWLLLITSGLNVSFVLNVTFGECCWRQVFIHQQNTQKKPLWHNRERNGSCYLACTQLQQVM